VDLPKVGAGIIDKLRHEKLMEQSPGMFLKSIIAIGKWSLALVFIVFLA
jgi:hypothetical protein